MSVKVEVTVTVTGDGFSNALTATEEMWGGNLRFAADSARIGVHRALKRVLQQMPPQYKEKLEGVYDTERQGYCEP